MEEIVVSRKSKVKSRKSKVVSQHRVAENSQEYWNFEFIQHSSWRK